MADATVARSAFFVVTSTLVQFASARDPRPATAEGNGKTKSAKVAEALGTGPQGQSPM